MENFDWFDEKVHGDDTYFTYVNKNRKPIKAGEQIFYCYDFNSNQYLLLNYGFCFPDNNYDSLEVPLRLDAPKDFGAVGNDEN